MEQVLYYRSKMIATVKGPEDIQSRKGVNFQDCICSYGDMSRATSMEDLIKVFQI